MTIDRLSVADGQITSYSYSNNILTIFFTNYLDVQFKLIFEGVSCIDELGSVGISLHKSVISNVNNSSVYEVYDDDDIVLRICFEKYEIVEI